MKILKPKNLNEILQIKDSIRFDGFSPYLAFFRGQTFDWPIKPNITRNEKLSKSEVLEKESAFFSNFTQEKMGIPILKHFSSKKRKHAQFWHNLFQAQHLGFYTRLTDWTQDFETALFFSSDDENNAYSDKNGVLYFYECPYYEEQLINFNREEDYSFFDIDPISLDKAYMVKHYSQFPDNFNDFASEVRRFRQDGSFIISTTQDIDKPLEEIDYIRKNLIKIIITPSIKKEITDFLKPDTRDYFYYASFLNNEAELNRIREITKKSNLTFYWNNLEYKDSTMKNHNVN